MSTTDLSLVTSSIESESQIGKTVFGLEVVYEAYGPYVPFDRDKPIIEGIKFTGLKEGA